MGLAARGAQQQTQTVESGQASNHQGDGGAGLLRLHGCYANGPAYWLSIPRRPFWFWLRLSDAVDAGVPGVDQLADTVALQALGRGQPLVDVGTLRFGDRTATGTAHETAVSKPKVMIVASRSLSMVLGTPTTGIPVSKSCWAMVSEPSPPMQTSARRPSARTLAVASTSTFSGTRRTSPCPVLAAKRPRLLVPRIVPPRKSNPSIS